MVEDENNIEEKENENKKGKRRKSNGKKRKNRRKEIETVEAVVCASVENEKENEKQIVLPSPPKFFSEIERYADSDGNNHYVTSFSMNVLNWVDGNAAAEKFGSENGWKIFKVSTSIGSGERKIDYIETKI